MEDIKLKRFLSLLLIAIVFLLSLSACTNTTQKDNGKINIVATIFPQYDFARQIVGEKANLRMLIPPAGESHTYEPTPQDIISIEEADIFLYIGGESDSWVDSILDSVDTQKTKIIKLIDYVTTVNEEIVEGMEKDNDTDETEIDEHIWTSPQNAIKMVNAISSYVINHKIAFLHTKANKLTGFLLFIGMMTIGQSYIIPVAWMIACIALFAAIQECNATLRPLG